MICAFFAIGAFVYLFSKYFDKSFVISKVGGGTLGIYVFHLALYKLLLRIFDSDIKIDTNVWLYTIVVLIVWQTMFIVSYFLTRITSKNQVLAFLFLGKIKYRKFISKIEYEKQ